MPQRIINNNQITLKKKKLLYFLCKKVKTKRFIHEMSYSMISFRPKNSPFWTSSWGHTCREMPKITFFTDHLGQFCSFFSAQHCLISSSFLLYCNLEKLSVEALDLITSYEIYLFIITISFVQFLTSLMSSNIIGQTFNHI